MNANNEELIDLGTVSEDTQSHTTPNPSDGGVLFQPKAGAIA